MRAIEEFHQETESIIKYALEKNLIVLNGPFELTGVNVYNVRCWHGFVISTHFVTYRDGEILLRSQFVTSKMKVYMAKKAQEKTAEIIPVTVDTKDVKRLIHVIRGKQIMLDSDLAMLYQVETGALNRSVKRNINRFPEDFCFQLTEEEFLRCQNGISKEKTERRGGRRYMPYAFTEQGISMLYGGY